TLRPAVERMPVMGAAGLLHLFHAGPSFGSGIPARRKWEGGTCNDQGNGNNTDRSEHDRSGLCVPDVHGVNASGRGILKILLMPPQACAVVCGGPQHRWKGRVMSYICPTYGPCEGITYEMPWDYCEKFDDDRSGNGGAAPIVPLGAVVMTGAARAV